MTRLATLTLAVSLLAAPAFAAIDGAWTAVADRDQPDRIYFSMTRGTKQQQSSTMPLSRFDGLSSAQIVSSSSTPARFAMRSEAGSIEFDGSFRDRKGAGQFTFNGNRAALDSIRALGVEPVLRKHDRGEEELLYTLTLFDVSSSFIRSMMAEGYEVSLDEYIPLRIFDVTPEYIHAMRAAGFAELSAKDLVASKIHGVTPEFIREMRAAGMNLTFRELEASRIHGATPEFAAEMRKLGYGDLSHKDLVTFRIHGVTPAFITTMRKLGYDLTPKQLVAMRIHNVSPEYIRELDDAGYSGIPVDKLIAMRISGVDAKFVRNMAR